MINEPFFRPCVIIPNYNHKDALPKVVESLEPLGIVCFIIDDGSDHETLEVLNELQKRYSWLVIHLLKYNEGKGNAMIRGFNEAFRQNHTHAVSLDADGQHRVADLPLFFEKARQNPRALICGQPVFDHTAPMIRVVGRRVSHMFVLLETLSFQMRDSLCGLRCYPLEATIRLAQKVHIAKRMDFETDIGVRLIWEGVKIVNIKTQVRYFKNGLSHYRYLKDNLLIAKLHLKLTLGMLIRLPKILSHRLQKITHEPTMESNT
ncbi:MAG: glycosyltransferase family 2 protein [Deltaproteobacteria bacterium]|nr:glycosyltransferase family 2 protein [Deltaproteobacteria bacterium]